MPNSFKDVERAILATLAMAACYALAATASVLLTGADDHKLGLWAANVVVFAIIARNPIFGGWPGVAGIAIGCFFPTFAAWSDPLAALLFSAAAVTYILLALRLTEPFLPRSGGQITSVRDFGFVLLIIGSVVLLVGATFAITGAKLLKWPLVETGGNYLFADAAGAAIFLPLALCISWKRIQGLADPNVLFPLVAWTGFSAAFMFLSLQLGSFPFACSIVPPLLAATRLRQFELSILCLVVGMTAIMVAVAGEAAIVAANDLDHGFQAAVVVTTMIPFFAGLLIHQMTQDRRLIVESEERHRRAMNEAGVGMVNINTDGVIVEANLALAKMFGRSVEDLIGRTVHELTYEPDLHIGQEILHSVRKGNLQSATFEKRYVRPDGTPFWVGISFSLVKAAGEDGQVFLISQVEDIDARKNAESNLAEMQERWDFALASAGQGVWDLDRRMGGIRYSATWTNMIGYSVGELDGDEDFWLSQVHPDDYEGVKQADLDLKQGHVPYFEQEYRIRHRDGHYIWILDRGRVVERAPDGAALRAIGTMTDITHRKEIEVSLNQTAAALAQEKERLRVTLDSIGDAVICIDAEDRITFMNPVAEKLTRVSSKQVLGKDLRAIYVSIDEVTGESLDPGAVITTRADHSRAMLIRRDGSRCSIREVVSPLRTGEDDSAGKVIVFQDFTDSRALQRELAHAASHDALTGLANRATFLQRFGELAEQVRKKGTEHQFLFIDLDRFKTVNDTGGHAAGDALLRRISEAIHSVVRSSDLVARLGGDEFGVLLTNCPQAFARLTAQSIVDTVSRMNFLWGGRAYRVGASVGVATLDSEHPAVDQVIALADEACYVVKNSGREGVAVAAEILPMPLAGSPVN